MPVSKPWYLSRTILINILMALAVIVGQFNPAAAEFIKTYAAEGSVAWTIINVILRFVTKSEIA